MAINIENAQPAGLAVSVDTAPDAVTEPPAFRKLTAADAPLLAGHLKRLEPSDRQLRFWGGVTDASIDDYCAKLDWTAAIVIGAFVGGELRGVGELVRVRMVPRIMAEVAFSVEGPWQNAGLGTELLRRVLTVARNRCIDRVYMMCLAENRKMQKIARKFEAVLSFEEGEVEARILPAWPSYFSLMEEAVEDTRALFPAIFDPASLWPGMGRQTA
jgi:RimJ/RimL family protein N-acetyltransferase